MKLHPELAAAYRLKEGFFGVYEASTRVDAQRRYDNWAAQITPATREAFRPAHDRLEELALGDPELLSTTASPTRTPSRSTT